ncbi:hypothetical protein [Gloeocapsa sp. PCC 7428]|nr:hypothetical protein [Gloeocapsa sp. PCC 7428]
MNLKNYFAGLSKRDRLIAQMDRVLEPWVPSLMASGGIQYL